jgi:hypothetical protein
MIARHKVLKSTSAQATALQKLRESTTRPRSSGG